MPARAAGRLVSAVGTARRVAAAEGPAVSRADRAERLLFRPHVRLPVLHATGLFLRQTTALSSWCPLS